MQLPVTPGKVLHILLIRAIIVEPAPLTEQPDELFRAGGGYLTAIQQMISLYHTANFLVLSLKNNFCFPSRKGNSSNVIRLGRLDLFAKVINPFKNRIQFSIFVKLVVPECWRNSTVRCLE
jgi:hypothetical protein